MKHRTRVIAVANQKGGVGKSTTAVSLGAALAELGQRVLVVDLDPQGNASTGLGIRHDARSVTVYEVLSDDAPITEAIVQSPVPNLFGIPSTIDLAGAEIELVSQFSRELKLRKAFEPLRDEGFDFVFLDCPPSLGLLTVNALAAAEELLVPIQCEYYALEGLGQLIKNVRLVQQNVNPALRLTGIVMTMFDPRTKLSEQVVEEVRRYFGDRVYDTIIPRTVRLSEAPGFGQPITVYDPRSRGAKRYRELAKEVLAKEPGDEPIPVPDHLPSVVIPPPEAQHPMTAPRPLRPQPVRPLVKEVPETGLGDEAEWVVAEAERDVAEAQGAESTGEVAEAQGAESTGEVAEAQVAESTGEVAEAQGAESTRAQEAFSTPPVLEGDRSRSQPEAPTRDAPHAVPPDERPEEAQASVKVDGEDSELDLEPSAEPATVGTGADAGTEDQGKRRWSLFRRGGNP